MPKTMSILSFDEFRSSFDSVDAHPYAAAARQQREFFRDPQAAEELLRGDRVASRGWVEWPDGVVTA